MKIKNLLSYHKNIIFLILISLFTLSLGANFYLWFRFKNQRQLVIRPEVQITDPAFEALAKVKQIMPLPQDEQPQVFTFTGNTPRNQPFVKDAKNGDVLLLYLKNQKAILFDPLKNQILKVGPLTFSTISGQLNENKIDSNNQTINQ